MLGEIREVYQLYLIEKNPATKLLTMFQLEVKNQYGYMFKDLPRDLEKGLAKLTGAFIKNVFWSLAL